MSYKHMKFVTYHKIGDPLYIEDTMKYKPVYRKTFELLNTQSYIHAYSHILNQDLEFVYRSKQHFLMSLQRKQSLFGIGNFYHVQQRRKDMRRFSLLFHEICRFNWNRFFNILLIQALDYFWISLKLYHLLFDFLIFIFEFGLMGKKQMKCYNMNKSSCLIFLFVNSIVFFMKRLICLILKQLRSVTNNTWYFKFRFKLFIKKKFIIYHRFDKSKFFYTLLHLFGFVRNVRVSIDHYNSLFFFYIKLFRQRVRSLIKKSRSRFLRQYSIFRNKFKILSPPLYRKCFNKSNFFFSKLMKFKKLLINRDFSKFFSRIKRRLFRVTLFSLFNHFSDFKYSVLVELILRLKKKRKFKPQTRPLYSTSKLFSKNRHTFNSSIFFRFRRRRPLLPVKELVKTKLINIIMKRGKQIKAAQFVSQVFFLFKTRIPRSNGSKAFFGSLLSLLPYAKLLNYKISGRKEKIFGPMPHRSQLNFGIKLLLSSALKRKSKHRKGDLDYNLVLGLFFEIYDISMRKRNCLSLNFMKEYNYLIASMRFRMARRSNNVDLNLDLDSVPSLLLSKRNFVPDYKQMLDFLKQRNENAKKAI